MKKAIDPYINSETDWKVRGPENIHHIFAKHLGGLDVEENKVKLYEAIHSADHRLFGTLLFREKILKLMKIESNALSEDIKYDLWEILQEEDTGYYYKDGIYRKR